MATLAALSLSVLVAGCGGGNGAGRSAVRAAKTAATLVDPQAIPESAVPAPGGAVHGHGVVARVGNMTITKTAFENRMKMEAHAFSPQSPIVPVPPGYGECIARLTAMASSSGAAPEGRVQARTPLKVQCARLYDQFKAKILKELLSNAWVVVGAEEEGIHLSDAELRKLARNLYRPGPGFKQLLSTVDETVPDLLWNLKVQELAEDMRKKAEAPGRAVTPSVTAAYYATHKAAFTTAEERDLGAIRARSLATALRVKAELRSGVSFETIARRLRPQPFTLSGAGPGLVRGLKRNVVKQGALDSAIFSAREHVVSGPVRLHLHPGYHPRFHRNPYDVNNIDGYYVFEVLAIRAAKVQPLSEVRAHLERELPDLRSRQLAVSFISSWRGRLRPKTDCRPGYVVRKCRQYRPVPGEEPEDPYTVN